MKKISLFLLAAILTISVSAQQGNGNGKGKKTEKKEKKEKKEKDDKDKDENEKNEKKDKAPKVINAKKVPAPVRKQFAADYPNATDVIWTKQKGKWTATFGRTVTTYNANGTKQ